MNKLRNIISAAVLSMTALVFCAPASAQVRVSVKEFLKMKDGDQTYCELKGVVSRIRNHEKGRLFINDGTGDVLIYGFSYPEVNAVKSKDIRKGDTLTVHGTRTVYDNRVIEMKYAKYVSHVKGPDHDKMPTGDELDQNPTFKGKGREAFGAWVVGHMKYPKEALDNYVDGKVVVTFVIGRDGKIYEERILEHAHPLLEEELLRVLRSAPAWKPGIVDGHPVRYTMTMPFEFVFDH